MSLRNLEHLCTTSFVMGHHVGIVGFAVRTLLWSKLLIVQKQFRSICICWIYMIMKKSFLAIQMLQGVLRDKFSGYSLHHFPWEIHATGLGKPLSIFCRSTYEACYMLKKTRCKKLWAFVHNTPISSNILHVQYKKCIWLISTVLS